MKIVTWLFIRTCYVPGLAAVAAYIYLAKVSGWSTFFAAKVMVPVIVICAVYCALALVLAAHHQLRKIPMRGALLFSFAVTAALPAILLLRAIVLDVYTWSGNP